MISFGDYCKKSEYSRDGQKTIFTDNDKSINESRQGESLEYLGHKIHIECYDMDDASDFAFIKQNIGTIWDILQDGYENLGGFKGYQSKKDLLKKSPMVKLGFYDEEIIAVDVFNDYLGGNKSVGITCFRNNKHEAGALLVEMIIRENIQRVKDWVWIAASGSVEQLYRKHGALQIPNEYLPLYFDEEYKLADDGFHFHYLFSGEDENQLTEKEKKARLKTIFGLKDKETYNELVRDAYGPLIDFLKRVDADSLDERLVYDRYFVQHTRLEKAKMIADKIITKISNENFYDLPQYLYDKFEETLNYLRGERSAGRIPEGRMRLHIDECIKNAEEALNMVSVLEPLELLKRGQV